MSDPRLTPFSGRVALDGLRGKVAAEAFVTGLPMQVAAPVADLLRRPGGGLDRQMLRGADVTLIDAEGPDGYVFVQSRRDGYVGWLKADDLWQPLSNTHVVTALATHLYDRPDIKSRALMSVPFGSRLAVAETAETFVTLIDGSHIPAQHVEPVHHLVDDFVGVIERFLGIPYLWGGNSTRGMDCSGAILLALEAAGRPCPRDTDMQEAALGCALPDDAPLDRGDLIFWKGHVGVMRDAETLIHANAHHMAVASEPLDGAVRRIRTNGGGPVTSRRRL
jgi:cell wall-associated NlpC family hydrolase